MARDVIMPDGFEVDEAPPAAEGPAAPWAVPAFCGSAGGTGLRPSGTCGDAAMVADFDAGALARVTGPCPLVRTHPPLCGPLIGDLLGTEGPAEP